MQSKSPLFITAGPHNTGVQQTIAILIDIRSRYLKLLNLTLIGEVGIKQQVATRQRLIPG